MSKPFQAILNQDEEFQHEKKKIHDKVTAQIDAQEKQLRARIHELQQQLKDMPAVVAKELDAHRRAVVKREEAHREALQTQMTKLKSASPATLKTLIAQSL